MALATAVVEIVADTSKFDRDLERKLNAAAANAGKSFDKSFKSAVGNIGNDVSGKLGDNLVKGAGDSGEKAGNAFSQGFTRGVKDGVGDLGDVVDREVSKSTSKSRTRSKRDGTDIGSSLLSGIGQAFSGNLSGVFGNIQKMIGGGISSGAKGLGSLFGGLAGAAQNVAVATEIAGGGLSAFSGLFSGISKSASGAASGLASFASSGVASAGAAALLVVGLAGVVAILVAIAAAAANAALAIFALPGALAAVGAAGLTAMAAFQGMGDAFEAAMKGDISKFEQSLTNLAPAAQSVAREFQTLVPAFREIQQAAQQAFFGQLQGQLTAVAAALGPTFAAGMSSAAAAMGQLAAQVTTFLQSSVALQSIQAVFTGLTTALQQINLGPLLDGFARLAGVGATFLPTMVADINTLATSFGNWLSQVSQGGQAFTWMQSAWETIKQIGAILLEAGRAVAAFISALNSGGQGVSILEMVRAALEAIANVLSSSLGVAVIKALFLGLATAAIALLVPLTALAATFILVGAAIGVTAAAAVLLALSFKDLFTGGHEAQDFWNSIGRSIGAVKDEITNAGSALSGGGADLNSYIDDLNKIPPAANVAAVSVGNMSSQIVAASTSVADVGKGMSEAFGEVAKLKGLQIDFGGVKFNKGKASQEIMTQMSQVAGDVDFQNMFGSKLDDALTKGLKISPGVFAQAKDNFGNGFKNLGLEMQAKIAQLDPVLQRALGKTVTNATKGLKGDDLASFYKTWVSKGFDAAIAEANAAKERLKKAMEPVKPAAVTPTGTGKPVTGAFEDLPTGTRKSTGGDFAPTVNTDPAKAALADIQTTMQQISTTPVTASVNVQTPGRENLLWIRDTITQLNGFSAFAYVNVITNGRPDLLWIRDTITQLNGFSAFAYVNVITNGRADLLWTRNTITQLNGFTATATVNVITTGRADLLWTRNTLAALNGQVMSVTLSISTPGRQDLLWTRNTLNQLNGQNYPTTLTITVTGMDQLREAKSALDGIKPSYETTVTTTYKTVGTPATGTGGTTGGTTGGGTRSTASTGVRAMSLSAAPTAMAAGGRALLAPRADTSAIAADPSSGSVSRTVNVPAPAKQGQTNYFTFNPVIQTQSTDPEQVAYKVSARITADVANVLGDL